MEIDFGTLSSSARYFALTQSVIPRPIAWVLSENEEQSTYNLAPFSFFNAIASEPPLVMISIGHKDSGEIKDTWRNIERTSRFTICVPARDQADAVQKSANEFEYGISEVHESHLKIVTQTDWPVPRIEGCPIAFSCRLYEIKILPPESQAIIFGYVEKIFVDDRVLVQSSKRLQIDPKLVDPLLRLGAGVFGSLGQVFPAVRKP